MVREAGIMNTHAWLVVAIVLFIVAAVVTLIVAPPTNTYPRWLQPLVIICAGLACLTAAFLVAK